LIVEEHECERTEKDLKPVRDNLDTMEIKKSQISFTGERTAENLGKDEKFAFLESEVERLRNDGMSK